MKPNREGPIRPRWIFQKTILITSREYEHPVPYNIVITEIFSAVIAGYFIVCTDVLKAGTGGDRLWILRRFYRET